MLPTESVGLQQLPLNSFFHLPQLSQLIPERAEGGVLLHEQSGFRLWLAFRLAKGLSISASSSVRLTRGCAGDRWEADTPEGLARSGKLHGNSK